MIKSKLFVGFTEGFKEFGDIITNIINFFLLSIVYFIGVGFTSLFAKIFNKSFLDIKKIKKDSYWKDLNLKKKPIEDYYKQF